MRSSVLTAGTTAALLASLLAGCTGESPRGSGSESGPKSGSTGSGAPLRYLVQQPVAPATLEEIVADIAQFEKSSGIDVQVEAVPRGTTLTALRTRLRSATGPDVFEWGTGPGGAGALADDGLLYDLTDAYEKRDWPVYEVAKQSVTVDGRPVGIPGDIESVGLFCNLDLLSEAGVAVPTSLTALRTAAATIRRSGVIPLAVGDREGWPGGQLLSMSLSGETSPEQTAALVDGDSSWRSAEVVRALQVWKDFNVSGDLPRSPTSLSHDDAKELFYDQDAAILPGGSSLVAEVEDRADFQVGFVPFPARDGPGRPTAGVASGAFVSASTKNSSAAVELLDFLLSPGHGRWTVETRDAAPAFPLTADVDASPLLDQVLTQTSEAAEGEDGLGTTIDSVSTGSFNDAVYDGMQRLLSGRGSARAVAHRLQRAAND